MGVGILTERPKHPNQIDVEVGQRIRLQRNVREMSQTTLADALGITFQQVQKYEKGTNRVGASRLSHIAQVLGVPVSFFFGDPQPSFSTNSADGVGPIEDLSQFLSTSEGRDLNQAFTQISSPAIKKKVVNLVKALAAVSGIEK